MEVVPNESLPDDTLCSCCFTQHVADTAAKRAADTLELQIGLVLIYIENGNTTDKKVSCRSVSTGKAEHFTPQTYTFTRAYAHCIHVHARVHTRHTRSRARTHTAYTFTRARTHAYPSTHIQQ